MLHEFSDFVVYMNQIQEGGREKRRGGETTYNYQIKLCLEKNVFSCSFFKLRVGLIDLCQCHDLMTAK